MSDVALIDAGGANLGSVRYALERLGATVRLVRDADGLIGAQRVILPGVGAAGPGMQRLHAQGLVESLQRLEVPLMGICLGMQLLFERSEEAGVETLGLIPGVVRKLVPACGIRVPHMGWNDVVPTLSHSLIEPGQAYFLHSFAFTGDAVLATTDHGGPVTAAIGRDNMIGVQFHPEKSQRYGIALMERFLAWRP